MTTHERMKRMYEHREADRVPVTDSPWGPTLARWRREGLPAGVPWEEYFGLDRMVHIGADNSPRYPEKTLEENDRYEVRTTSFGATIRNWKDKGSVPEFLDFTVKDPDTWRAARERMKPDRDRVDWDHLKANYREWRKQGAWITAEFWFGFDVTHSWFVGTERVLQAMAEDPEWLSEVFNHMLDLDLALFGMMWDAGYEFDSISWPDDMGYKGHQFFSPAMYKRLVKPVHKRACDWAHARGAKVQLHSCGDIRPLVPDLIEIGVDMLNPVEVKAGMDPLALKKQYGDRLAFHGGINVALYDKPDLLWPEMRRVIPEMKKNGGYVASSDHSVPESFSLENFREFVRLAKELGSYG
jgi:uroporphyrinogen decarboxylase